jgi:hypothetical protein
MSFIADDSVGERPVRGLMPSLKALRPAIELPGTFAPKRPIIA